ncbi:hypothetical protein C1O30_19760 [Dickeya zeae]|nr:hypothetical protein C1O30_19760 [Dickeya zeae]
MLCPLSGGYIKAAFFEGGFLLLSVRPVLPAFNPAALMRAERIMFCYVSVQELSEKFGKLASVGIIRSSIIRH